MTLQDLLTQLVSRGIQLSRAGDRLCYRPVERMTPELAAVIRAHKSELMALSACDCCDCWPLMLAESRVAGVCLRCLPPEQYSVAIKAIGARHRKEKNQ
jgi:hypothetical protein